MKRKITIYAMLITLVAASFSIAGEKVGTTSFQFLKLALDARAASMGGAYVSIANTSEAVFWNPAGLMKSKSLDFSASYLDYFLDVNLFSASFSYPISNSITVGLFGMVLDYGDFEVTSVANQGWNADYTRFNPGLTGEIISPSAMVLGASYAMSLTDKFSFGVSAKYISENLIRAKASVIAFDGGLTYNTGWNSVQMGISVRNFGPEVKFINEPYPLPETFTFGISGYLLSPEENLFADTDDQSLLFSYDLTHPRDYDQQHNVGMEYSFKDFLFLRMGYKFNYDEESITYGLGIRSMNFRLDYAYDPFGEILQPVHRFTVGFGMN